MAGKRELKVVILGDSSKAQRAFNALERSGSNLGTKMGGLGSKMAGVTRAIAAAGIAAGTAAAAFGVKALNAASDLNEQISKVGVVFGESAKTVIGAADEMAKAFGIPKTQFLEAAGSIGLVGKASGLAQKDAADLGVHMAKLGIDASSFYNVPLEEALTAIRSGLVGEAEPMRRFGVLLSAQAVDAEAARLGLEKVGKEYTEGAKAQARASLITKGMKDATGDLVRTQDSFANRLRELRGRAENFAAAVGTRLLPIALRAFDLMEKWAPVAQRLGQRVAQQLTPAFKTVGNFVAQTLVPALGRLSSWFQNTFIPAVTPAANFLKGELLAAFDKVREVVEKNKEKLKEIADFLLLEFVPQIMELVGILIHELAPAFATVVNAGVKIMDWFKELYRWINKTVGVAEELRQLLRLFTGNLGFNPQDNFKNITPEQFDQKFGVERSQKRKGGGYGMTGSWSDNSITVNVNGGKSDRETGEAVAREVSWRRKGWGR